MPSDPITRPIRDTVDSLQDKLLRDDIEASRVVVVYPASLAQELSSLRLYTSAVTFGRSGEHGSDVVLFHPTVSKVHGRLSIRGPSHVIEDLGSLNGTWLNGVRLGPMVAHEVKHGDLIRVGDVLMVYERATFHADCHEPASLPGDAWRMHEFRASVQRVANDPAPVLITGETGVGKEHVARAIHAGSGRPGPFVPLNCAALSAQLIEAQLFGHVRGSFTGAVGSSEGVFRAAEGGTLFLDEIAELPIELQPKLLRALQEKRVQPVGAARTVPVNVRIVAATNRVLQSEIEAGQFRRDLYARLAFHELSAPSLRDRRTDILFWVTHFARAWESARERAALGPKLTAETATRLLLAEWPDNLRGVDRFVHRFANLERAPLSAELDQVVGRLDPAVNMPNVEDEVRSPLGNLSQRSTARIAAPPLQRPRPDRDSLVAVLRSQKSVRAAANAMDRDRKQIYRWLAHYNIDRSEWAE